MIKSYKNIVAAITVVALSASCADYLNEPPVAQLSPDGYYATEMHFEQGVKGAYSSLRNVEIGHYQLLSEDRSDNVWLDPAPNALRAPTEVSYMSNAQEIQGNLANVWSNWYGLIYNSNTLLGNIANIKDGAYKNQLKGELLFLRGFAHFELARVFGNVPIVDKVLSSTEAKSLGQSKPEDVIAFAIKDMQEAEKLLPYENGIVDYKGASAGGTGRADKIVVQATLARVYMTLYGWPFNDASAKASAKSYLESVLKYSKENGNKYWAPNIDEWRKQWLTDQSYANKYQIFSIPHTTQTPNTLEYNSCGHTLSVEYVPSGNGNANGNGMVPVFMEVLMHKEYEDNKDLRGLDWNYVDGYKAIGSTPEYTKVMTTFNVDGKDVKIQENALNIKWLPDPFKAEKYGISYDYQASVGGWPVNFPLIRLEDMMLLYAELLVEDGNIPDAIAYVNQIRERAGVALRPTSCTKEEAVSYIRLERKLELYLEGVRWFDMIRYGIWDKATKEKWERYINSSNGSYKQTVSTSTIKEGRHYTAIPYAEMQAVPGLYKQNPGW